MGTQASALADYIHCTPGVGGGRPCIRGTRTKVSEIVRRHEVEGESADQIVSALPHLSLAQVYAALAYYHDHREEIHEQMRKDEESILDLARKHAPHLLAR